MDLTTLKSLEPSDFSDAAGGYRAVTETFTQEGSEPDNTLTSLRAADGEVESGEALGSPF